MTSSPSPPPDDSCGIPVAPPATGVATPFPDPGAWLLATLAMADTRPAEGC
ncbi:MULTISPECIES: hypothetical protein [unclassified Streptomyces]|uniref:hypothetical protein n=1 Tax=unclassified Streptomyces TaxID=2593676 RepID=UPI0037AD5B0D